MGQNHYSYPTSIPHVVMEAIDAKVGDRIKYVQTSGLVVAISVIHLDEDKVTDAYRDS